MEKSEEDLSSVERQAETPKYPSETMSGLQKVLLMSGLGLATFTATLNSSVVSPSLSAIAADLDDLSNQLWVATAYIITFNASQPLYGKWSDIFGRKPAIMAGLAIFLIGSLLSATAVNMIMLIIARAVQGLGGGGVLSMVLVVIGDIFPVEKRLKYQSVTTAMFGIASVVGPLMGGAFADNKTLTWRWDFLVGLILGGISLIAIFFLLHLPHKKSSLADQMKNIDYWGTIVEIIAVVLLMLVLNWGGTKYEWNSGPIIGLFIAFAVFLAAFIFIEAKVALDPVVPPRLFKNLTVVAVFICQFLVGASLLGIVFYQPTYSQVVFGANAMSSGIRLIPLMMSLVIFSIITAVLLPLVKRLNVFIIFGTMMLISGFGGVYTLGANSTTVQQAGYLILCGGGVGCCMQMNILAAQAAVEKKDMAVATTIAQFASTLGGAVGLAIFGSILQNDLVSGFAALDFKILEQAAANNYIFGKSALSHISLLPEEIRMPIVGVYVHGIQQVFLAGIVLASLAFLTSLLIRTKETNEVQSQQD